MGEIGGFGSDDEDDGISGRAPSPARSTRATMGIPATVCNGLGTSRAHARARAGGKHDETNPFVLSR